MRAVLMFCAFLLCSQSARAEDISFKGKTIKMVVGFAAGGGTDTAGRFLSASLAKHLSRQPTFLIQHFPVSDGMTAMNFMVQLHNPDGPTPPLAPGRPAGPVSFPPAHAPL